MQQAIAAQRGLRTGGIAALGGFAANVEDVGLERGHPFRIALQMLALRRESPKAPIPTAAVWEKMNARVGGLDLYARHGVMLAEVGASREQVRRTRGTTEQPCHNGRGRLQWRRKNSVAKWGMIVGIEVS